MISLIAFLQHGRIGSWRPGADSTPQAVFAALGPPDEVYTPTDLDRPYRRGDAGCFPLIASYGDIECHFESETALTTVFVDGFSGRGGYARGGPLALTDTGILRAGTPLARFLDNAARRGIAVGDVRPHAPPYAFLVTTAGGIEVGFEHDDPALAGSVPRLKWFCWVARPTPGG